MSTAVGGGGEFMRRELGVAEQVIATTALSAPAGKTIRDRLTSTLSNSLTDVALGSVMVIVPTGNGEVLLEVINPETKEFCPTTAWPSGGVVAVVVGEVRLAHGDGGLRRLYRVRRRRRPAATSPCTSSIADGVAQLAMSSRTVGLYCSPLRRVSRSTVPICTVPPVGSTGTRCRQTS